MLHAPSSLGSAADASMLPLAVAPVAAPAAAPVARLYRHAVESIFAFASVAVLAALLCVSRERRAAVSSMAPCKLERDGSRKDELPQLCASPLARHIHELGMYDGQPASADVALLCSRMPHLMELNVRLAPDALVEAFPP